MIIASTKLIYFSPTRTTATIVKRISQGIGTDTVEQVDLAPPSAATRKFEESHDDLVIIGTPVYGGRVPEEAVLRLQQIKATHTPAVIIVVYGNREYDDALLELRDLTSEQGFTPIAGGTFIGEHSYHSETTPIAGGRPDPCDMKKAEAFGEVIRRKVTTLGNIDEVPSLQVPGRSPYQEWTPPSGTCPVSEETLCELCGICAAVCPTGAISVGHSVLTDQNICILCSACVKKCPTGARSWDSPWIRLVAEGLSASCRERKEPEFYL